MLYRHSTSTESKSPAKKERKIDIYFLVRIMGEGMYAERQCNVLRCTHLEGENCGDGMWTVVLQGMRRKCGFPGFLTQFC